MSFLRIVGITALGFVILNGCSKELSRGKAKDVLQKSFEGTTYNVATGPFCGFQPIQRLRDWAKMPPATYSNDPIGGYLIGVSLERGGYATVTVDQTQKCGQFQGYRIALTPSGELLKKDWKPVKTYPNGDEFYAVKIADTEIVSITGISTSGEGVSTVEYKWKMVPTSQAVAFPTLATTIKTEEQTAKSTLKQYDDGWRLMQ